MNEFSAFVAPIPGGYHAMIRMAHDGQAEPVLGKGGKPKNFATELEAQRALTDNLVGYLNGNLSRWGEIAGRARDAADKLFPSLVRAKGKSRATKVERKRQA